MSNDEKGQKDGTEPSKPTSSDATYSSIDPRRARKLPENQDAEEHASPEANDYTFFDDLLKTHEEQLEKNIRFDAKQVDQIGNKILDEIKLMFEYASTSGLKLSDSQVDLMHALIVNKMDIKEAIKLHEQLCSLIAPVTATSLLATETAGGWRVKNSTNSFLITATVTSLIFYIVISISLTALDRSESENKKGMKAPIESLQEAPEKTEEETP